MKKFASLSLIVLVSTLFVGCATNSDIENLQSQIDGLNAKVTTAAADAAGAKSAAADASARASAAEAAANRAAGYARDTNDKLDRMFKQSMMK